MPDDPNVATINGLAVLELLNLPKLYGPNGFLARGGPAAEADPATGGPPVALVAALERLETATVDPALLSGGQTVASVEAKTVADLGTLARITRIEFYGASSSFLTPGASILYNSYLSPSSFPAVEADAGLFTPGAAKPPVTVVPPPPPPASGVEQFLVQDAATGVADWEDGQAYAGPVAGLRNQFVATTVDGLSVTATKADNFIHTGAGDDAIDLSLVVGNALVGASLGGRGTNVVDAGAGSNFISVSNPVSAPNFGTVDTVLVDERAATADSWNTVRYFHEGDAVTIYGVTASNATLDWENGQGAAGTTGLTLHVLQPGGPTASLTLVGSPNYTKADLSDGRLGVSLGYDAGIGAGYLHVQATGL